MAKAQRMAELFGVLADPNCSRLLSALASQELCVCDLAAAKMSESAVSHQLRILRTMRLVSYRREGRNVYYSLADSHIINLYREVAAHLDERGIEQRVTVLNTGQRSWIFKIISNSDLPIIGLFTPIPFATRNHS